MAMEINSYYNSYASSHSNAANSKKQTVEKTEKAKGTAEPSVTGRKTAAEELSYLSKKYSNYSFVAANYTKGMKYGSDSTVNVAIAPQFLAKMANDPDLEAEYETNIAAMQECDEEFARMQAGRGWRVAAQGWAIDKDGGVSSWAIITKDSNAKSHLQTMSENAEKIRRQNAEKKQAAEKTNLAKEKTEVTRKTAQDELSYLSEKYKNYTLVGAEYKQGMRYGSIATTNIAISPQFLKKMANDPELEKEYESYFKHMRELDEENIRSHAARGRRMVAQGWAIDKDGGISRWGISEPTDKRHYGQEMTDYANKIRQEKAEKKQEQEKKKESVLKNLQEKYSNFNITSGIFSEDQMSSANRRFQGVVINPAYLSKAERDSQTAKDLDEMLSGVESAQKWLADAFRRDGLELVSGGYYIDENGNMSSWSLVRKKDSIFDGLAKQSEKSGERIEKQREKVREQKKAEEKKAEEEKKEKEKGKEAGQRIDFRI